MHGWLPPSGLSAKGLIRVTDRRRQVARRRRQVARLCISCQRETAAPDVRRICRSIHPPEHTRIDRGSIHPADLWASGSGASMGLRRRIYAPAIYACMLRRCMRVCSGDLCVYAPAMYACMLRRCMRVCSGDLCVYAPADICSGAYTRVCSGGCMLRRSMRVCSGAYMRVCSGGYMLRRVYACMLRGMYAPARICVYAPADVCSGAYMRVCSGGCRLRRVYACISAYIRIHPDTHIDSHIRAGACIRGSGGCIRVRRVYACLYALFFSDGRATGDPPRSSP
jgi:hypothetical protein